LVICGEDDYRFIGVSSGISIFSPLGRRWVAERINGDGFEKIVLSLVKKPLAHQAISCDFYKLEKLAPIPWLLKVFLKYISMVLYLEVAN